MLTFLLALLLALPLLAAPGAADEMLASFQTKVANGEDYDELFAAIADMPGAEQKLLIAEIDKTWSRLRDDYLKQLALTANTLSGKKNDTRQEIRKHRDAFKEVYAMDEAAMKPLLKSTSMPAIEALRKLLSPDPAQIIEAGGEKLHAQRKLVTALATFRDGTLNAMISTKPVDSASTLATSEQAAAAGIGGFERSDLKILAQNRKVAKDREIPEAEARGIEECNELRMLVGLNALFLDPKLCEAARDHSKDMAEQGFFAHESPVPGKKLPWDRAKNFGTSASAENIFMGSGDPHAANLGWFYSPGHHKNMFSPGHLRMGLGCSGSHWTQMFGR
ncbi:MAG: CAP domain-containing protein [Verrucomicrobia bacterium]|nr:CAP domain-containing protein [Verrucomicrobiota bacterium]